jgi:hypothetical protein
MSELSATLMVFGVTAKVAKSVSSLLLKVFNILFKNSTCFGGKQTSESVTETNKLNYLTESKRKKKVEFSSTGVSTLEKQNLTRNKSVIITQIFDNETNYNAFGYKEDS